MEQAIIIETQTREQKRTDIIVDYLGEIVYYRNEDSGMERNIIIVGKIS